MQEGLFKIKKKSKWIRAIKTPWDKLSKLPSRFSSKESLRMIGRCFEELSTKKRNAHSPEFCVLRFL